MTAGEGDSGTDSFRPEPVDPTSHVEQCIADVLSTANQHRDGDLIVTGDMAHGYFDAFVEEATMECRQKGHFANERRVDDTILYRDIHLWPNGVVWFRLHTSLRIADPFRPGRLISDRVREIVRSFSLKSNVSLVEIADDNPRPDYVDIRFVDQDVCKGTAMVGYEQGAVVGNEWPRTLLLTSPSPDCHAWNSEGTIHHELGHSIGMPHEQQRDDRHEFLRVHPSLFSQAISTGNWSQLKYRGHRVATNYDFNSIMHYDPWGSVPGRPAAVARTRWAYTYNRRGTPVTEGLTTDHMVRVSENHRVGLGPAVRSLEEGPPTSGAIHRGINFLASALVDDHGSPRLVTFNGTRVHAANLESSGSWNPVGPTPTFTTIPEQTALAVGDMTGDGVDDYVVYGQSVTSATELRIAILDGATLTWSSNTLLGTFFPTTPLHLVDWNGDGTLNACIFTGSMLTIYSAAASSAPAMIATLPIGSRSWVAVGNFDSDPSAEFVRSGDNVVRNHDMTAGANVAIPNDYPRLGAPLVMRRRGFAGGDSARDEILFIDEISETVDGSVSTRHRLMLLRDGAGTPTIEREIATRGFPHLDDVIVGSYRREHEHVELWLSRDFTTIGGYALTENDIRAINMAYPHDPNPREFMYLGRGLFVPAECQMEIGRGYCP